MTDNQDFILTIARQYAELGWCVLPVPHRQKFPDFAWAEFQTRQPSADELKTWFRSRDVGMCVICGTVSSNLAVLDFDASGSYQAWAADHAEIAEQLPTDRRGDRYHVFIRTREPLRSQNLSIPGFDKAGEILAEGKLCVLPPTIHASGEARKWLIEPIRHVPLVTMEELGLAQPTQAEQQNLASEDIGQGERHSKLMSLAAKLRAQGHGQGFIFDMLLSVNGHRCKPPLPEQEIRGIAEWAGKQSDKLHHPYSICGDDAPLPSCIITTDSLRDDAASVEEPGDPFLPLSEYLALSSQEIPFIVEGFLPETYLVIIGGTTKAGKSCLMTLLSMAVAQGKPFLGMPTNQAAVLWVVYEESELERGMMVRYFPDRPENFYHTNEKIMIDKPEGLATLRRAIKRTGAKLIILDPLYGSNGAESLSDGRAARKALSGLKDLCREQHVTAIFIHHFNKQVGQGVTRERMADSNQILATASMDWLMEADELADGSYDITMKCRGRGIFANRTIYLHSPVIGEFELVAEGKGSRVVAEGKLDSILKCLQNATEPMTAKAISRAVKQHHNSLRNRLTTLQDQGKIEACGKYGQATLYRLAPAQGELLEVVA